MLPYRDWLRSVGFTDDETPACDTWNRGADEDVAPETAAMLQDGL